MAPELAFIAANDLQVIRSGSAYDLLVSTSVGLWTNLDIPGAQPGAVHPLSWTLYR